IVIGPEMRRILDSIPDGENYERLLTRAHCLGISIHSGGVNYSPDACPSLTTETAQRQIAANCAQVIGALVQADRSVASFSHLVSNAITPPLPAYAPYSFVSPLLNIDPNIRIVEVDMVVSELISLGMQFSSLCTPRGCHWLQFTPPRGVALVQGNTPNSYLLYLSRTH
ncbi:MAG: hypothetical protein WCT39_03590, partial [Candidatus Margulisiibacteriota bacterium]